MERRDDASSSPENIESCLHRHHQPSSDDVIERGHQQVTCSGEVGEVEVSQCEDLSNCTLSKLPRPIRSCCDVRAAEEDQGAELTLEDDGSQTVSANCSSWTERSEVNRPHRPGSAGSCGGGASGGTHLHLGESSSPGPTLKVSDSDPETQEGVTSDLQEVSSEDDEAFATDLPPSPPPGELRLPASANTSSIPASAIPPHSRNTFECGRRQSAPGQLVQEDGGSESELQSRRPGIVDYFSSRKQRSVSHSVAGWKLFGKVPPKQSPSRQARVIQQSSELSLNAVSSPDLQDSGEFEARQVSARSSPSHQTAAPQSWRKVEFEPLSTTALILEDRPLNLPAKSAEETQRHREQYEEMVAGAKRKELKEAQRRQQQRKDRLRQEEEISTNTSVWNHDILPHWDTMRSSRRARDLWWGGLPPSVRGRVWSIAIGNELNITADLYEIFLSRARERWRSVRETEEGAWPADRESSLELITRDLCRTFPSLCVFQKGGPYHDLLQSILGAYTCYRPDVGYVQGMSSMAAMLVLNMEEVDAFISFSNLINKPCQLAFSRVDHQQMLRYFGAFQVFLEETLPSLFLHFLSSGVTPDLYLMDWILSLYTKPLPLDVACRVWDVFFRDGEEFLFRTALGILRMYQDVLLGLDLISIAQFLSRLPDEELLSDRLFSCISATPMLSGNRKWIQVLTSCRDPDRSS